MHIQPGHVEWQPCVARPRIDLLTWRNQVCYQSWEEYLDSLIDSCMSPPPIEWQWMAKCKCWLNGNHSMVDFTLKFILIPKSCISVIHHICPTCPWLAIMSTNSQFGVTTGPPAIKCALVDHLWIDGQPEGIWMLVHQTWSGTVQTAVACSSSSSRKPLSIYKHEQISPLFLDIAQSCPGKSRIFTLNHIHCCI